jgi:hypothetical protein
MVLGTEHNEGKGTVTGFLLLFLAILLTGFIAWLKVWQQRIQKHSFFVIFWRLLIGHTWHGGAVSDRGWFRHGSKALTPSGHVSRRRHIPQFRVARFRLGMFFCFVFAVYGLITAQAVTLVMLMLGMLGLGAYWTWRGKLRWDGRKHRREWLAPLHLSVHRHLGRPISDNPESYIRIAPDRSSGELDFRPAYVPGDDRHRKLIESHVTARLGLEGPRFDWRGTAGPAPVLEWRNSSPVPDGVPLAGGMLAKIKQARPGYIILGLGAKDGVDYEVVQVTLLSQSPHLLLNGPTDSGKSALARSIAAQFLFQGGFAVLMDAKEISHTWADSADGTLPNISYVRDTAQIHAMFMWLWNEMRNRNRIARENVRRDGTIPAHVNVGVPIMIVCEELNSLSKRLRTHWNRVREPSDSRASPAIDAMNELLYMGRQARMYIVQAAQRGEANAVGGGAARENLTARILVGLVQKKTWDILATGHPYPANISSKPGHAYVVRGGVQEVQLINMSPQEAWDLSLAGKKAAAPEGIPFLGSGRDLTDVPVPGTHVLPGHVLETGTETPVGGFDLPSPLISLRQAVAEGIHAGDLGALRMWRTRRRQRGEWWPEPADYDSRTELYNREDLEKIEEIRQGNKRKVQS